MSPTSLHRVPLEHRVRRPLLWRCAGLVLLVAVLALGGVMFGVPSEPELRTQFASGGVWSYLLFAGLYAVIALLPVPKNVFSIAAGAVFGFVTGLGVVLVGATAGAVVAFGIGRILGRDVVNQLIGRRAARLDEAVLRRGIVSILTLRLVPIVPFTALNYLAGATAVRFRDYVIATAIGIIPGASAYVALGAFGREPDSLPFLSGALALMVLSGVGITSAVRRRRKSELEKNNGV